MSQAHEQLNNTDTRDAANNAAAIGAGNRVLKISERQPCASAPPHGLILAAGRGSRLERATDGTPKCLIEIGGQTILQNQLDSLAAAGVESVTVVTGYQANQIANAIGNRIHRVHNPDWADTNSLYSLELCRHLAGQTMVVLNCDVLADPEVLQRVVAQPGSSFAYDSSSGLDPEEMKVELKEGVLAHMSKRLPLAYVHGENVGILKFDASITAALFEEARNALADGGRNAWMAETVQRLAPQADLVGVDVVDLPWIEIDFPEDLVKARLETWPAIAHNLPVSQSAAAA